MIINSKQEESPLSPAAQAVLDAAIGVSESPYAKAIAAELEALQ